MSDARLEVTDAQGRRLVTLDKPTFTIGRRGTNDLQLTGTDISRLHAEILRNNGQYLVRDCGSRCGTYVNGTQVTEKRLSHGDKIQVGNASLVFEIDGAGDGVLRQVPHMTTVPRPLMAPPPPPVRSPEKQLTVPANPPAKG